MTLVFSAKRIGAALSLLIAACSTDRPASDGGGASGGVEVSAGDAGESSDVPAAQAGSEPGSNQGGSAGTHAPDAPDASGAGGEAGNPNDDNGGASTAGTGSTSGAAGSTSGAAGSTSGAAGSTSGAAGSTSGAAGSTSGAAGSPTDTLMIPCDVNAALNICRNCHTVPLAGGAPFPLLTLANLQSAAGNAYGAVSTGEMPLGSILPTEDRTLILAWLGDGAKGVPKAACTRP